MVGSTRHEAVERSAPREPDARQAVAVNAAFHDHECAYYDRRFAISHDRGAARRARAEVERLLRRRLRDGEVVLDVGCGTGWGLPRLARSGATIVGIELSSAMRARAAARIARGRCRGPVSLDPRPYGSHDEYADRADHVVFSYSLSMIPPFAAVVARARADLRPGGTIAAVDFLDATSGAIRAWLRASHVHLGPERLALLERTFPAHRVAVRSAGPWSYYLFWGDVPSQGANASQ